jgi:hypothetical protein
MGMGSFPIFRVHEKGSNDRTDTPRPSRVCGEKKAKAVAISQFVEQTVQTRRNRVNKPWLVIMMLLFVFSITTGRGAMALDPCSFITQEEAAAVLGEAVKPPKTSKTTGFAVGHSCTYHTAAPLSERGGVGSVSLVVYDNETLQTEKSMYSSASEYFKRLRDANESTAGGKIRDLDGLGEKAYWQEGTDQIHILASDMYFVLSVKDLTKISSDEGRDDLNAKISAHRMEKCRATARTYLFPKLK